MRFYYDSKNRDCKSPFGAVCEGEEISFRIFCGDGVFIDRAFVKFVCDGGGDTVRFPLAFTCKRGDESEFVGSAEIETAGLYWYVFELEYDGGTLVFDNGGKPFQQTVFAKDYRTPDAFKGGVIYHIFVDRFNIGEDEDVRPKAGSVMKSPSQPVTVADGDGIYRANDFYGGNLQGIIDKLDYLAELGVTVIYLSPIFLSPSNHRYDTSDYGKIDELLGSEASFVRLCKAAEAEGMKIMLDGVFNHTGADSVYFNKFGHFPSVGAYQSKDSPYADWYSFSRFPDMYDCWWGVTVCPTVNKSARGYRNMILGKSGVLAYWLKKGASAWRLDVVDELEEEFVREIRTRVKAVNRDALVLGEVWEDASNKISYGKRRHYLLGAELDGVMNYPFKEAVLDYAAGGDVESFVDAVNAILENYPKQSLDVTMNLIDSHDTVRALSRLSKVKVSYMSKQERRDFRLNSEDYAVAKQRLMLASALQFALPGIPSIFYGDEGGMQGFEDPLCRGYMPWNDLDEELEEHYKFLGRMRARHRDALLGETRFEYFDNGLLVMVREGRSESLTIVANSQDEPKYFSSERGATDLKTGRVVRGQLIVAARDFLILYAPH